MKLLSQYINACVQLLALMVLLHSPVATMGGPIDIVKKMIDAPIDDIQWADDENIFVLTDKKTLFRSQDKGRSWQNQARTLSAAAKGFSESEVEAIYTSPVNPAYVLFVGKGANSWVTTNMGNDYTYISKSLQDIRLHPTRASWILASSMSPGCERPSKTSHCFKGLLLSKDFGRTWKGINEYVVQFDWSPVFGKKDSNGHHSSDEIVYATVHKTKNGNQKFGFWSKDISFYKTTDFFASSDNTVVEFGNRFLFGEHNYLFVAAVNPQKENEVLLQISRDNVTHIDFQPAILPVSLSEHSYTILDTSEGSVFLHVNHQSFSGNAYAGHVYVSDWTGVVYSLSLPYNHRLNDGKCDFEKVEGIEGIYMANFIDEDEMDSVEKQYEKMSAETKKKRSLKKRRDRLHTKTVITYDKGGEWNYLTPPTVDASGNAIKCNKCHLHLHGVTDTFGPFYSSKNALGLIMATGTIGRYLEHNKEAVNTYLSRDAGLTWKEVAKGSHIYEFADHGGLVLMANDVDKTDTLLYSWDEGTTWNGLKISNDLINIENIIVEPKSTSTQVIVYGWQEDAGVMIFVDFAGLHERECQGYESAGSRHSDYEYWSPSDGRMNGKCLLGHTVQYTRRKADSQCYNPQEFERKTALDHCPCTEADYQCDYGYERANGKGPCVEMTTAPYHANPFAEKNGVCPPGGHRLTKGYRRVPGDTCAGGEAWDAVVTPCATSSAGKVVFFILVAAVGTMAALQFYQGNDRLEQYVEKLQAKLKEVFTSAASKGYSLVGGGSQPFSAVADDDNFYLNDDDFGPEPHLIDDHHNDSDSIDEAEEFSTEHTFQPLPPIEGARAMSMHVPVLSGPDGEDNVQDLLNIQ